MEELSVWAIGAVVAAAMFLGAIVKGVIGFGLPLVVLPILTFVVPPPTAIALLTVPVVGSNILQAWQGGGWRPALRRFWPLIAGALLGLAVGIQLLTRADAAELHVLIGITVCLVALAELFGVTIPRPKPSAERATSAGVGVLAGVIGGMTSMFGPPVIAYMVGLKMGKDAFVSAIAVYYVAATFPFSLALVGVGILGPVEVAASVASMIPIALGIVAGTALRKRIAPELFRRIVLIALFIIGAVMIATAVGDL